MAVRVFRGFAVLVGTALALGCGGKSASTGTGGSATGNNGGVTTAGGSMSSSGTTGGSATSAGGASSGSAGSTTGGAAGCDYDGKHYAVGDHWPAGDGCNNCECTSLGPSRGQQAICTLIACIPADAAPPNPTVDGGSGGTSACDAGADPSKTYVGHSPTECMAIRYSCPNGDMGFSDSCGCGCQKPKKTCEIAECFRAVTCVTSCGGPVVSSGCCPCDPPAFDSIQCAVDAGPAAR
jgi:hypothetical protein